MSTALPVIRGGSTALYPFTQQYVFYNTVSVAETADSYRSPFAPPTVKIQLPYNPVVVSDRNTLLSAFNSAKGQFTLNLSATIDKEYDNLSFDSDVFSSVEQKPTLYSVGWNLTQWAGAATLQQVTALTAAITSTSATTCSVASIIGMPVSQGNFDILIDSEQMQVTGNFGPLLTIVRAQNGTTAATHSIGAAVRLAPGNPFPTITGGCLGQYPFTAGPRFQTITSSVGSGPKFTYAEFGAGLTGFPTTGLGNWQFDETLLSDSDAAIRIAHYIAQWGNLFPFAYTDENGTTYSHCYYADPTLEVRRNFLNENAIKINIVLMKS